MVAGGKTMAVTVSIGVATAGHGEIGITGMIERADNALYQAKRAGRDRYSVDRAVGVQVPEAALEAIGPPVAASREP